MPLVPALGRQRLKNLCEFKANLVYRNQESQGYTEKPCLEKSKERKKKEEASISNVSTPLCPPSRSSYGPENRHSDKPIGRQHGEK